MKFVLETITKSSGRLGCITQIERLPDFKLQTPLLLLYTKAGSIPNLGREVLDYVTTESQAVQLSVSTMEYMEEAVKLYGKGVGSYVGMNDSLIFVALKDTGEKTPSGFHEKNSIPIFTKSGRISITPTRFMNIIEAFRPDFYHPLCDGDTNIDCSRKRGIKSVERSEEFLVECIKRHKESAVLKKSVLVGAVEGGYDNRMRHKSIEGLLKFNDIGGYLIDGLHQNGSTASNIDINKLTEIVKMTIDLLPENKFKIMSGAYNPVTILKLIKLGVDIFDTTYAHVKAQNFYGLTFNFHLEKLHTKIEYFINFSDKKYKEEFIPILEGCQCLACRKHTRAYIHHLITTNELLAPILITIHNLHHYLEFFKTIRICIATKKLEDLINLIEEQAIDEEVLCENNVNEIKQKPEENTEI